MDAFEKLECIGRTKAIAAIESARNEFFQDWNNFSIKPTKGKYAKWDFELLDRDNNNEVIGLIEAKDRYMLSTDKRLIQGAQLEYQKYESLLNASKEKNVPVFFLCTYEDDKFYIWDLEECQTKVTIDERMCNATTAVLADKVLKKCVYFKKGDAFAKGSINNESK